MWDTVISLGQNIGLQAAYEASRKDLYDVWIPPLRGETLLISRTYQRMKGEKMKEVEITVKINKHEYNRMIELSGILEKNIKNYINQAITLENTKNEAIIRWKNGKME